MASTKLDAAGVQKMNTLESALQALQTIHGHVERMGVDIKAQKPVGITPQVIKRLAGNLQGQLKGQFGMIADQISGMILASSRGGSDTVRLRIMREYVAQIRTALELTANRVKEQHSEEIASADD
ncbi:MAG: hypothetical protein ACHQQ3_06110 [Gemmatimonadales bacterium]